MTTHPFGASSRMLLANLTVGNIVNSGRFLRPPSPQFWGSMNSKSPKIDTAGKFNTWKYWHRSEGSLRPPNPQFWGSISSKSPRIGGFRGLSAVLTMLRNNAPAASSQEEILAAKGLAEFAPYLPIKGPFAGLRFQSRPKQASLKGISSQGIEVLAAPPKYATEPN